MKNMTELNKHQEDAVKYCDGPLLMVAGPGSGKTTVLIEKVLYLVKNGCDPNKILVSTFTNKSAEELKDRLRKVLGDSVENMQISTIHSFCQKMLETFPEYHNFGNIFKVLDDLDQFLYVNKNIWNYGLKDYINEISVSELINFYNKCTENNVSPLKLVSYYKENKKSELDLLIAKSYELYIANLLNPNDTKLDFALLQREFYNLISNNSEVLEQLRDMFDYILIDEYQDTNPIQDAIFKLISEPKYKITVVGDEDQSIYGFRGASVENFRTFLERYPNSKKIELEENFRSTKEIVDCFDSFMRTFRTFEKNIFTNKGNYSKPLLLVNNTDIDEAINIASVIKKLVESNKVKYEDIVILFKSVKYNAKEIILELEKANIPFVSIGDSSLLSKEEIKEILILMSQVNSFNPNDNQKRKLIIEENILKSEILNLKQETIEKLSSIVDIYNLLDSFDYDKLIKFEIDQEDINVLIKLKNLKTQINKNQINQLNIFYKVLDSTNYLYRLFNKFFNEKDRASEIKLKNLAKFSKLIFKFENTVNSKEFKTLLYYLDRIPENKMEDSATYDDVSAVKLMTIHQAKGLEFPVVILAGVTNRRYNSKLREEDKYIIEIPADLMLDKHKFDRGAELRRTFYVGMSRTEKLLIISTIDGKNNKPSEFISDIGYDKFSSIKDFDKLFFETDHYKPKPEKINLSYSSVNAYIDCPFKFYCSEQLEFQIPIGYFQAYGTIVHNCLKKLHIKIKEKGEVDIQDVIEIIDLFCKDDESRRKWRDELVTDLWNYYENSKKFIKKIIDVELPFSYINSDLIIKGQVDLVIKNKNDELEIIDFKSFYKTGLDKTNVDIQLRLYNVALKNRYSEPIKHLIAYTFKDNNTKIYSNSEEDLEKSKKLVYSIHNAITLKQFKRNWNGSFCETRNGKCQFYYVCKKFEEGN